MVFVTGGRKQELMVRKQGPLDRGHWQKWKSGKGYKSKLISPLQVSISLKYTCRKHG